MTSPIRTAALAIVLSAAVPSAMGQQRDRWTDPDFVARRLADIPPMRKSHLSTPQINPTVWRNNEPAVREHIRITRAVGYGLNTIDAQLRVFDLLDDLAAEYDAVPYVAMSPFHVPTAEIPKPANLDFTAGGFWSQLAYVDYAVSVAARHMARPPAYALLDCEVFRFGVSDFQDAVIYAKLSMVYGRIKQAWPNCQVIWFGQGATGWQTYRGWLTARTVSPEVPTDGFSVGLYRAEERLFMRECYRKTCAVADTQGIRRVLPWFSFSYHKRLRVADNGKRVLPVHERNVAWDTAVAWELGHEFDTGVPPWTRAEVSCGWPTPYVGGDLRPGYWEDFDAFARGAAGLPLPPPEQ